VTHRTLRVRVMATPDRVEQTRSVQYQGRALALSFDSRTDSRGNALIDSPSARP
jgi:alpha-D-xyloside xylohydrolase